MTIRTRLAPSPTGRVHIGTLQKLLYSYALARKKRGKYILRIEDTDRKRFVKGAEKEIYQVHDILGIKIDESPRTGGEYGPYKQSKRLKLYQKYAQKLVEKGYAYYAFETPQELDQMRKQQQKKKKRPKYQGKYRDLPLQKAQELIKAGKSYVIRIKVPKDSFVEFRDEVMGKISVKTNDLDDYVLLKSDGFPTYHLAVVVDDHLMKISHVIRGVEWLPTAPVHVLLYQMFDLELPKFVHIPNILDPKGGKLSKRSGSVAAMDFFKKGYLAEAIINFMILLGWSPKTNQEIFSLEEFIKIFNLKNLNKSNPLFNKEKLIWMNQQYIRKMDNEQLLKRFQIWIDMFYPEKKKEYLSGQLTDDQLMQIIDLEKERIEVLLQLFEKIDLFMKLPDKLDFSHRLTQDLDSDVKKQILQNYLDFLINLDKNRDFDHEVWEKGVRDIISDMNLKPGQVFMTIRIAVTGKSASPPIFKFGKIIGMENHKNRVRKAIKMV